MLRRINISNYILIDSLDLHLPEGLIVVTGETGAGKSILLGAVSLLLGAKADISMLGDKSRNCVVEAEFSVCPSSEMVSLFDSEGLEFTGEIILRRVVSPSGRSRSFLNDEPVNIQFLSAISSALVDIHSQHQHLMLADERFRMSVLDTCAGDRDLLDEVASCHALVSSLDSRIASLEAEIQAASKDRDYRRFQLEELDKARLSPGEMEQLEAEQKELSHAEEIKALTASALSRLYFGESSFVQEMKESVRDISKIASAIPRFEQLGQRLESCRIELQDIESELESAMESVNVSPERLEEVDDRLSLLWDLMKKHSCQTVEELIRKRDSFAASLSQEENAGALLDSLKAERCKESERLGVLADRLHSLRVKAASELSPAIRQAIRSLEIPYASFSIDVSIAPEIRPNGKDSVRFLFSSSPSMPPDDVSKSASGGELSRVMLCIKAFLARYKSMATLIFDEIDTGVSGSAADKIGVLLGEMGANMQIMAITHLPQVAARGKYHFCVRKHAASDGKAVTTVHSLSSKERVEEIARLLSGSEITDSAKKNAEALLEAAGNGV